MTQVKKVVLIILFDASLQHFIQLNPITALAFSSSFGKEISNNNSLHQPVFLIDEFCLL